MQDNPRDFDTDMVCYCDKCDSKQMGTEVYANDAMGMAVPVLWNCHRCQNPPLLVGWYRELQRLARRAKAKYNYWRLPAEEKQKREEHRRKVVARINERRQEEGRPLLTY